jgi:2-methylcitrate dehydratase PrpD
MAMGVTEKLAAHAFNVRYEDMPQDVIEKAKDCLLDQIGRRAHRVYFGLE